MKFAFDGSFHDVEDVIFKYYCTSIVLYLVYGQMDMLIVFVSALVP